MCEVTTQNFEEIYPELEKVLHDARFIAVDLEFSCMSASNKINNSLFDSGSERYTKLKSTIEKMIPLQVGLTAFEFNSAKNSYIGHLYTFYVLPMPFDLFDKRFLCQTSSLQFLADHGFDFNKLIHYGLSFLNNEQEAQLIQLLKEDTVGVGASQELAVEIILKDQGDLVATWFFKAKDCDTLVLTNVSNCKPIVIYMLHKTLRSRFSGHLWTYGDNKSFTVMKVDSEETLTNLQNKCAINENLLDHMLGFTKVFRLLKDIQKPIIGHNLLYDIMVLIHNFETPLPKSYNTFKKIINRVFPSIYDTKHINFQVMFELPENKRCERNILEDLYGYFKNGQGRHLALNSPAIEPHILTEQKFHSAGWDSFCTGYIFIRMAHMKAAANFRNIKGKTFVPNELLNAVVPFKNKVNVIRADVAYIDLQGKDPDSQRPPPFIIESIANEPVSVDYVTSLLSAYGFVEVKPHSNRGRRVIVAVDNFGSAKRILRQFPTNSPYTIQQYNFLKHSPVVRGILWYSAILSAAALTWFGCTKLNRIR